MKNILLIFHASFWCALLFFSVIIHGAFNSIVSGFEMATPLIAVCFWGSIGTFAVSTFYKIRKEKRSYFWLSLIPVMPILYISISILRAGNSSTSSGIRTVDICGGLAALILFLSIGFIQAVGYTVYGPPEFAYGVPDETEGWEKVEGFLNEGFILRDGSVVVFPEIEIVDPGSEEFREAFFLATWSTPLSDLYVKRTSDGNVMVRIRNSTLDTYLYFFPGKYPGDAYFPVELNEIVSSRFLRPHLKKKRTDHDDASL